MRWQDIREGDIVLGYTKYGRNLILGEALPHRGARLKLTLTRYREWIINNDTNWELLI